jgi:hypothetical protein
MMKIATTKNIERTDTMMKMKTTTKTEALVLHVEQLELGAPWAEPMRSAEAAIAAERATAEAELFPRDIVPVDAGTIAMYQWLTGRFAFSAYGVSMADIHSRAFGQHPELARLLRSTDVLDDIDAAAGRLASPTAHETHAAAADRAAGAARARYQLAIARQVVGVPGHELAAAASAFLAAEELATRLAAARARHEEHERIAAEQAAAAEREAASAAEQARIRAEVDREIAAELTSRGLPPDLKSCPLSEQERARIEQLALTRVRLRTARVSSIRVNGSGRLPGGLYYCGDLSRSIGSATAEELGGYIAALDRAEAEARS